MRPHRKLWLHVGIPKTATTAFQTWMRRHADVLAEQGLLYPPLFGAGTNKHNFLVGALRRGPDLQKLEDLLDHAETLSILLSDEGLSNHLDDFSEAGLTRFRELTQNWDVQIILVTREAEAWTRSYHKQCVLNPANGASPLWGTELTVAELSDHPRIRRFLERDSLAQDLAKAFGAKQLHQFAFEDGDWFEACLKLLGLNFKDPVILPKTNQSLPDWAIEAMRQVNRQTKVQSIRNRMKVALQHYLQSNHTILTNLTQTEKARIDPDVLSVLTDELDAFPPDQRPKVKAFFEYLKSK